MLELKNISKSFFIEKSELKVLKNISINFRKNEFVSIIGKSGSGKTTLLNIIGLLDEDYCGKIYLKGRNISSYKKLLNDKLLRSKIGFVFQDYNLIEELTVYQNIDLALKIKGIRKKGDIDFVLKKCNILSLKYKRVNYLSGGEKQRVAIARTLVTNPDIILLDEPTGALDKQNSESIIEFIKEVFYDKLVIMITHDKILAKKYSDRIIILEDGRILYDSSPYLFTDTSKLFISKRKMNYLDNIKYSFVNLKRKKFRNVLTIIAITISITVLSLVMFLSSGFKVKIMEYKRSFLITYPLVITKNTKREYFKNKINRYDYNDSKTLDTGFILSFNEFCKDNNIKCLKKYNKKIMIKTLENDLVFSSYLDKKYLKQNYKLVKGRFPLNDYETLVKIDKNYVNGKLFDYFGTTSSSVNYDYFLSKTFTQVNNNINLSIVGIVKPKSKLGFDEIIDNNSDFLYRSSLDRVIKDKKVYSIYVYGKKEIVKEYLNSFPDIKYQDVSKIFEEYISKILVNVQTVLMIFSFISIFISLILIVSITYTAGLEREKEIGILKSLGARKLDIRRLFTNEVIILSSFSVFISLLLMLSIIPIFNNVFYKYSGIKNLMKFSFEVVFKVVVIGFLMGLIGSLIPAKKNSKKDVIKCLK